MMLQKYMDIKKSNWFPVRYKSSLAKDKTKTIPSVYREDRLRLYWEKSVMYIKLGWTQTIVLKPMDHN